MSITLNQSALSSAYGFQKEDAAFVAKHGQVMLGHPTGQGKSLIGLMAWASWPRVNRVLVLGGKSSASTWNKQPMEWADTQIKFIAKPGSWDDALTAKEGIWHATYDTFRNCMSTMRPYAKAHWDLVIADEAHKLRSRKTLWYKAMLRMEFDKFIGMSATWASRGPQDLWAILHLIHPRAFMSYWHFVETYCYVEETAFGRDVFGIRNAEQLRERINSRYYRSRTWESIGWQIPPIRREIVEVEMTPDQAKVYADLDKDMFASFDGDQAVTPTVLAKITRLHQIATYPQLLFPNIEAGGALEDILERVEDDPHTVIYTYFAQAILIIKAALASRGYLNVFSLQGGTSMKDVDLTVAAWKKTRGVMICSVKFAESFRIDTTHTAYVLSFSFDPNENVQAEGRLRAIDSLIKSPVLVRYYIVKGTIVESVKDITNEKVRTISQIFQDYAIFRRKSS